MILRAPCPGIGFSVGPLAVALVWQSAIAPVLDGAMLAHGWVDSTDRRRPGATRTQLADADPHRGMFTGVCVRLGRWPVLLPDDPAVDLQAGRSPRHLGLIVARRGMGHCYRPGAKPRQRANRRRDQLQTLHRVRTWQAEMWNWGKGD